MLIHDHIYFIKSPIRQFVCTTTYDLQQPRYRHRMRKLPILFMTTSRRKRVLHKYSSLKECRMQFRYASVGIRIFWSIVIEILLSQWISTHHTNTEIKSYTSLLDALAIVKASTYRTCLNIFNINRFPDDKSFFITHNLSNACYHRLLPINIFKHYSAPSVHINSG